MLCVCKESLDAVQWLYTYSKIIVPPHVLYVSYMFLPSAGGRNLPRSLLGSTAGSDGESGVFAVPTTLPPNSSRHNRMFSPNKEAELALKQQLDSISVRQRNALFFYTSCTKTQLVHRPQEYAQMLICIFVLFCFCFFYSSQIFFQDRENLETDNFGNHL